MTSNEEMSSVIMRDWITVKGGDMVWHEMGWREVFDAMPISKSRMLVKVYIGDRIDSFIVRTDNGSQATCKF